MQRQSIKNAISRIHKKNPRITLNAAAQVFAEKKGFSIFRSLSAADKESLGYVTLTPTRPTPPHGRSPGSRKREIQPDFASPFIKEANDNTEPYAYIYLLENGLRKVILDKLGPTQEWWSEEKRVPKDVQDYAARIQEAEKKYPWVSSRGAHPIYYVGLHELFRIIESSWRLTFRDVFGNLEDLRTWLRESIPIRNLIAHNVRTRPLDRQNIKIRTDSICRLIQRWDEGRHLP